MCEAETVLVPLSRPELLLIAGRLMYTGRDGLILADQLRERWTRGSRVSP